MKRKKTKDLGEYEREVELEGYIFPLDGKSHPIKRKQPKTGRNEACPCGSGKKYKKCCKK